MADWPGAGGGGGYDYVQDTEPPAPVEGEEWYDTGSNESQVYDGANWHIQTVGDFNELAGKLAASQIPDDVIASRMLAADSVTSTAIAATAVQTGHLAADAVTSAKIAADAIDSGHVASGAIDPLHLSFDPASQAELDSHAGDVNAHHSPPTATATTDQSGGWEYLGGISADNTWSYSQKSPSGEYQGVRIRLDYNGGGAHRVDLDQSGTWYRLDGGTDGNLIQWHQPVENPTYRFGAAGSGIATDERRDISFWAMPAHTHTI